MRFFFHKFALMLDIARRNNSMYPQLSNNAVVVGLINKSSSTAQSHFNRGNKPTVKAATLLGQNSSTDIIDISKLSQKVSPLIQYVEVADAAGRLYCVDQQVNTSCWLKIVAIAKDCQSCNVLLMSTDKGVVLKTIKRITPGEPLLMWFTENVLAMLNMPYLTNLNIKGQNRYICHVCNNHFEYPNPLKIHLALKCNRLDSNYLWSQLAKEIRATPHPLLSVNIFQKLPSFNLDLVNSPQQSPNQNSTITFNNNVIQFENNVKDLLNNTMNYSNYSPTSSNPTSPSSSTKASPSSPDQYYSSTSSTTTQISPTKKNISQRHSAFKPYINKLNAYSNNVLFFNEKPTISSFQVHASTNPSRPDVQAAQVETIVSNLGKSKQGHLCIYCGKVYSRKYGLKIHIRTHTGYKPLKCKFCMRPFGDPSNLNKHVRLHADGDTPYRCDLCGKVLVRRRDLERHIRSRHEDNMEHHSDSSDGLTI